MYAPSLRTLGIAFVVQSVTMITLIAGSAAAAEAPLLPPVSDEQDAREFDWVQITSGEWIKGEFERMHDDKLYFDSDEFGNVTIDWGDVATLLPVDVVTIRLPRKKIVTGKLVMRNGELRITTESGVVEVGRGDVRGIIMGSGEELSYWSASASLGFSGRAGNKDQSDLNIKAEIRRQTSLTRFTTNYLGQISSSGGDTTANSHRVPAAFDIFLTDRFFITTPAFEYFTDEISNIGSRVTVGAGLGYEVVDTGTVFWEVGSGAAYQYTSFESVQPGDDPTSNDLAIVLTTSLDFDLPRGVELDNSYKVQLVATNFGNTNHHLDSVLSFDIWGPLDLEVTFIFDRIEQPLTAADGTTPQSNDYTYTVGLGIDF